MATAVTPACNPTRYRHCRFSDPTQASHQEIKATLCIDLHNDIKHGGQANVKTVRLFCVWVDT